jgi:hypothetical protein
MWTYPWDVLDLGLEAVTSLTPAIRDAADPASRVHVLDIDDGWRPGCDLGALARVTIPADRTPRAVPRVFYLQVASATDVAARLDWVRAPTDAARS